MKGDTCQIGLIATDERGQDARRPAKNAAGDHLPEMRTTFEVSVGRLRIVAITEAPVAFAN
jgi:hypothetical protein